MRRLSNPQTGLLLSLLCAIALGLNGYTYWQTGEVSPSMLVPSLGLLAMLVAMPFLSGWRPNTPPTGHVTCSSCHLLWSPADDGTAFCPGCGKVPKTAASTLQKHPYASPLRR